MKRSRATFYYRLSLLMVTLAFVMFLVLIAALFYLVIQTLPPNPSEVCTVGPSGICWLREEYQIFYFITIFSVGLMAVFLILASQFQQYFIPESLAKLEQRQKAKADKKALKITLQERMKKPQLEVFEAQDIKAKPEKKKPVETPEELPIEDDSEETLSDEEPLIEEEKAEGSVVEEESLVHEEAKEAIGEASELLQEDDKETDVHQEEKEDEVSEAQSDDISDPKTTTKKTVKRDALAHQVLKEKTKMRRTQAHTKEDLSVVIESLTSLTLDEAKTFIDSFTEIISDALIAHDKIAIHKFGTFYTKELKARTMNVPTTKEKETTIDAHHVIRFKPSPYFMEYLNDAEIDQSAPTPKLPKEKKKVTKKPRQSGYHLNSLTLKLTKETPLNQSESKRFLDTMLSVLQEELSQHNRVVINGFGTFKTVKHDEKAVIVPTKEDPVIVPEHHAVKFTPTKRFLTLLNPEDNPSKNR